MFILMDNEYQNWRSTGYLFGTIIYMLDAYHQYYEPSQQNLQLFTGMMLGVLITEQECFFNKNRFTNAPFEESKCYVTLSNLLDGLVHVWVFNIITKINLYYLNEQRDEYVIYKLVELYHKKHQKSNIKTLGNIPIIDMVHRLKKLPNPRREWSSDDVKCSMLNIIIHPCMITIRRPISIILQWMDITHSFQNNNIFQKYNFFNTGKIISKVILPENNYYFKYVTVCSCGLTADKYYPIINEERITFKEYYLLLCKRLKKICNKEENKKNQEMIECKIASFKFI